MKSTILFFVLLLCQAWAIAQQPIEKMYAYVPDSVQHIIVRAEYGQIHVYEAVGTPIAQMEIKFTPDVARAAVALGEDISVDQRYSGDTLFLSTLFSDKLNKKTIEELDVNFLIKYDLFVSPHMNLNIYQKHGEVYTLKIQNNVKAHLESSFMSTRYTKSVDVSGNNFRLSAGRLPTIKVQGKDGDLNFTDCRKVELDLEGGRIQSMGFDDLRATVKDVEMSAGRSGFIQLSGENASIEFTDIQTEGIVALTDSRLILQKLPPKLSLQTTGGETKLALANDRNVFMQWNARNTENHIWAKYGSVKMSFKQKKLVINAPKNCTYTKKSLEFMQRGKHGLQVEGQFYKGQLEIKP